MSRQDREWVDKKVEAGMLLLSCHRPYHLHVRPVLLTEEAGTVSYSRLVNARSSGHDSCRVILRLDCQSGSIVVKFTCEHILQRIVAPACIVPDLELPVEEACERGVHIYLHALCRL